ncbi:hypothetical protein [Maritalea sp.]|uniref:hypothetical protein n=1 Tax=Maritalea sp. TaxID=2003361 RepID=UPI0039E38454
MIDFVQKAYRPAVVRRAAIMAIIVGVIIAIINYFDKMMVGSLSSGDVTKIIFTFLVPYAVSTVSSVLAINETQRARR